MTDYDRKPEIRVTKTGDSGSSTGIAIIIAALVLVIGAFVLFNGGFNTTTDHPKVVQNNNTLPAPVIEMPVTPEVVTPPAAQKANPPADAPAANP